MKLPSDYKAIINSTIPLLGAIILFIIAGSFGISKISDIRSQISQAQSDQNSLRQNVNLLQAVTANAQTLSNAAVIALPDSNTSLAVFSQLKNLAVLNTLALTNMRAGASQSGSGGLSRVDVSFDVAGGLDQTIAFLKGIPGLAPIMVVTSLKINQSGGATLASVVVSSFWAELPKTVPAFTQAASQLTPDEEAVITGVQNLAPPIVITAPATNAGRPNPFATPAP